MQHHPTLDSIEFWLFKLFDEGVSNLECEFSVPASSNGLALQTCASGVKALQLFFSTKHMLCQKALVMFVYDEALRMDCLF